MGAAAPLGLLWDFGPAAGYGPRFTGSADRPRLREDCVDGGAARAPAQGKKWEYFRSVNPGWSECPSQRARETTDSPASSSSEA